MNALMEVLNRWGGHAIDFASGMLWQSSVLIVALLVLDVLLRRRARAVVRYALWSLVILKLVLPPSLALPTGLGYWLRSSHPTPLPAPFRQPLSVITFSDPTPWLPSAVPTAPVRPRLAPDGRLLLTWFAGSTILLGFLIRRSGQVARLLRQADSANPELQSLLDQARRQLGLCRPVHLKLSPSAFSPAVCGLRAPVVLLPRQLAERLPHDQLRPVLLHELLHLKRRDVWVNCLQALLQVVYWWHPLVWLANARIRRVREEAVDEAVMVALGAQAETYPATLLEVAKLAFARPLTALGLVGIFESKSALHQRIRRLLDRPVPRSAKLNFAGLLSVATCGALLLPMARGHRAEAPTPSTPPGVVNSTTANVLVECRFLDIDEDVLRSLSAGPPDLIGTNGHRAWVVPPAQVTNRLDALTKLPGVRLVSAPRLTLVSGMTGQISDSHADSLNGRNVNLRSTCEVTPRLNGTDIDLTLKASLTELAEVNGTGPPVLMTHAPGYASCEVADVRVSVPDHGGLIVHNLGASTREGRHLLLIVKPVILREDGETPAATDRSSSPTDVMIYAKPEPLWVVGVSAKEPLETRIFTVNPNTFREGLQSVGAFPLGNSAQGNSWLGGWEGGLPGPGLPGPTSTNQNYAVQDAVRAFFTAAGVNMLPPNGVYFKDRTGVLMVRATSQELDIIQKAIEVLNVAPPQLTIEAKFIEAPEAFVKGITQGTLISSPDATNQMRILSEPQTRALMQDLEKATGVRILSAPKVTTLSGRQTQTQVVDFKTIVTGIDPQAVVQPGKTASAATNASPFITQPIPLGPTLDVIPHVADDGYTVRITAIPTVTEFLSYDKPGPNDEVLVYKDGGQEKVPLPLPRFRNRQMVCTASVWDGQTLLLFNPAVTVLSKQASGDSRTTVVQEDRDRRLLVLITPTVIDPAGNPIHTPDNLPFDPESVPPQPK